GPSEEESPGNSLVRFIREAVRILDRERKHSGPFVCVLDNESYFSAHRASQKSPILPVTRMEAMLKGPVLRSGCLATNVGIVVATSAEPLASVLGTPPEVEFLQVTAGAKGEEYVFRVYERFILCIKDPTAIYAFQLA